MISYPVCPVSDLLPCVSSKCSTRVSCNRPAVRPVAQRRVTGRPLGVDSGSARGHWRPARHTSTNHLPKGGAGPAATPAAARSPRRALSRAGQLCSGVARSLLTAADLRRAQRRRHRYKAGGGQRTPSHGTPGSHQPPAAPAARLINASNTAADMKVSRAARRRLDKISKNIGYIEKPMRSI